MAGRALRVLRSYAVFHGALADAARGVEAARCGAALARWRAGRRRRHREARATQLGVALVRLRAHVLLQALTRWFFIAAVCSAAEHRAACEARFRGLQQAVAAFGHSLQSLEVLRHGGRSAPPAARSMVDKMCGVLQIWESSRLAAAFGTWWSSVHAQGESATDHDDRVVMKRCNFGS